MACSDRRQHHDEFGRQKQQTHDLRFIIQKADDTLELSPPTVRHVCVTEARGLMSTMSWQHPWLCVEYTSDVHGNGKAKQTDWQSATEIPVGIATKIGGTEAPKECSLSVIDQPLEPVLRACCWVVS